MGRWDVVAENGVDWLAGSVEDGKGVYGGV